ncbi:MAG: hypothetical protein FWC68_04570 [Oscillospiraceae bacterium]|nr:hypothetical protein [Oscillospiraceae bacterium]
MNKLQEFIDELRLNMPENLSEIEVARYVYIKLGEKMAFNEKWHFGNSKEKREIVQQSRASRFNKDRLSELLEEGKIVCISLTYLYNYILEKMGIDCHIETSGNDDPHISTIINTKNGKSYRADLQNDLHNIQAGRKTGYFAKERRRENLDFISDKEMLQIDRKIGYIPDFSEHEPEYYYDYSNTYIGLLKKAIQGIPLAKQAEFVFNHIGDYKDISNMGYVELVKYYKKINMDVLNGKLNHIPCFLQKDGNRENTSFFLARLPDKEMEFYVYSKELGRYENISPEQMSMLLKSGLQMIDKKYLQAIKAYLKRKEEILQPKEER